MPFLVFSDAAKKAVGTRKKLLVFTAAEIDELKKAGNSRRPTASGKRVPRKGSLYARVIDWARDDLNGDLFDTPAVRKRFKLTRAHASMLLSNLANGPYAIVRECRGWYKWKDPDGSKPARKKTTKKVTRRKPRTNTSSRKKNTKSTRKSRTGTSSRKKKT